MAKSKIEKFYKSQEIFRKYKNEICTNSRCHYQVLGENVLIEKWEIWRKETGYALILVEFYPDGDGFTSYFAPNLLEG